MRSAEVSMKLTTNPKGAIFRVNKVWEKLGFNREVPYVEKLKSKYPNLVSLNLHPSGIAIGLFQKKLAGNLQQDVREIIKESRFNLSKGIISWWFLCYPEANLINYNNYLTAVQKELGLAIPEIHVNKNTGINENKYNLSVDFNKPKNTLPFDKFLVRLVLNAWIDEKEGIEIQKILNTLNNRKKYNWLRNYCANIEGIKVVSEIFEKYRKERRKITLNQPENLLELKEARKAQDFKVYLENKEMLEINNFKSIKSIFLGTKYHNFGNGEICSYLKNFAEIKITDLENIQKRSFW